ncbi:MAG: lysophospholipid acyltransferase family protein [Chitinophagales bacterium]|nr:lysophospholipid acyltransferase family protein [Chitinophagales bacterium]MDW8274427.1 lysophospholipid acyltransferase family protein [Chitinophagales bacterium]
MIYKIILFPLLSLLSRLPSSLLYAFGDVCAFFLAHVIRYRRRLVMSNLHRAFPEKSMEERRVIAEKFYRILGERIAESIMALSMSKEEILKRCCVKDLSIVEQWSKENFSIVALLGHCGAWEWAALTASIVTDYPMVVALYSPPRNKYWDEWINKIRGRFGLKLISMRGSAFANYYRYGVSCKAIHLFLADQSPGGLQGAVWCRFLNSNLPFLSGPARFAAAHQCKILYVEVVRLRRGYYEIRLTPIDIPVTAAQHQEITCRYAKLLEAQIYRLPEDWLWSHKRWKHADKAPAEMKDFCG